MVSNQQQWLHLVCTVVTPSGKICGKIQLQHGQQNEKQESPTTLKRNWNNNTDWQHSQTYIQRGWASQWVWYVPSQTIAQIYECVQRFTAVWTVNFAKQNTTLALNCKSTRQQWKHTMRPMVLRAFLGVEFCKSKWRHTGRIQDTSLRRCKNGGKGEGKNK